MQDMGFYTVVVADDEDELREAVCGMTPWEKLGFRLVGSASNGLDALELVEKLEPDLLLTDIRMPFITGIELARQVREIRPSMNIAFLSGYDDFEYAKQAIQYNIISYMLKPLTIEGLSRELTRIHGVIDSQFRAIREETSRRADRTTFLMPLVLDDFAGREPPAQRERQLRRAAAEAGFLQNAGECPHFVVMVSATQGAADGGAAQAAMVERISAKYLRSDSFCSGSRVVTVLSGNQSDFDEYLHILAEELTQVAQRVLQKRCIVGVSREADSLCGLHRAYREAMDAFSYAEPENTAIRFISDLQPTAARTGGMTDSITQVEDAFKSGVRQQLETALEEFFCQAQDGSLDKNWLDTAALQLVTDVYRTLYTMAGGDAVAELQSRSLIPDVGLRYRDLAQLKEELTAFCTGAQELFASQQKKGGSALCQRALEAIDANFADETLSLNSLASLLDVSPNYLSACIRRDAGESFINILIRKRMEAARRLLLSTTLKTAEVARRCGYSDQHYFSYCFKKYSGLSPAALRRQADAGQNGGRP